MRSTSTEDLPIYCEKCEEPGAYLSMLAFLDYVERHILCPACEHYRKSTKALK